MSDINKENKNSLQKDILLALILAAVIPSLMAAILGILGNIEYRKNIKALNKVALLGAKTSLKESLYKTKSSFDLLLQSRELSDFLFTQDSLRIYITNSLYGKVSEIISDKPEIKNWHIFNKKNILVFSKVQSLNKIVNPCQKEGFYLSTKNDTIIYSKIIRLDDQYLDGPAAKNVGCSTIVLSLEELLKKTPTISSVQILSPILKNDGISITLKLRHQSKISLVTISIILCFTLLICLGLGFRMILNRILHPIVNLTKSVKISSDISSKLENKNEISNLKNTFEEYIKRIKEAERDLSEVSKLEAISLQAKQVAHDIRSPLTALDMALYDVSELPESKRTLIRNASRRIHDIANNLLVKNKHPQEEENNNDTSSSANTQTSNWLISSLVEIIVSEKRSQFRSKIGIDIDQVLEQDSYGLFAKVNANELKRIVSNLVNNAVEAMETKGKIEIGLTHTNDKKLALFIRDNGKGIPADILAKLGQKGITFGKEENNDSGSGLGVYHAKTTIESWGGELDITSTEGKGTTFTLKLPLVEPPNWFVPHLELAPETQIIILDDDVSIHQIWKGRFESFENKGGQIQLHNLSTPEDLRSWVGDNLTDETKKNTLFLCDYELIGFKETGLDLIEELNLQDQSILVTSRFEEDSIRTRCSQLGIKSIPKGLANLVPIINKAPKALLEAILIDDDELIHMTWGMSAKDHGKQIKMYKSVDEFFDNCNQFDLSTPVYIDSNLGKDLNGNTIKGEEVSKEIYDKGFHNIYLCTGYDKEQFSQYSHIKGIVGKDPVWL